jgi:hypothetical protein
MAMKTVGLSSLTRECDAITVEVRIGQFRYTITDVHENIVRCAIGEADMAYLLGEEPDPEWKDGDDPEDEFVVPARDESRCFRISTKEFRDMMRHGVVQRDFSGRADNVFAW